MDGTCHQEYGGGCSQVLGDEEIKKTVEGLQMAESVYVKNYMCLNYFNGKVW